MNNDNFHLQNDLLDRCVKRLYILHSNLSLYLADLWQTRRFEGGPPPQCLTFIGINTFDQFPPPPVKFPSAPLIRVYLVQIISTTISQTISIHLLRYTNEIYEICGFLKVLQRVTHNDIEIHVATTGPFDTLMLHIERIIFGDLLLVPKSG